MLTLVVIERFKMRFKNSRLDFKITKFVYTTHLQLATRWRNKPIRRRYWGVYLQTSLSILKNRMSTFGRRYLQSHNLKVIDLLKNLHPDIGIASLKVPRKQMALNDFWHYITAQVLSLKFRYYELFLLGYANYCFKSFWLTGTIDLTRKYHSNSPTCRTIW